MLLDLFSMSKEERVNFKTMFFNTYVDVKGPNECWLWKGTRLPTGYGTYLKNENRKIYSIRAHRAAWMLTYDTPVPPTLFCCHSCDNPPCANPAHIFLGTARHNFHDALRKGRAKKVVGRGSFFTLEQKIEIVREVVEGKTLKEVAQKYGSKKATISDWIKLPDIEKIFGKIDLQKRMLLKYKEKQIEKKEKVGRRKSKCDIQKMIDAAIEVKNGALLKDISSKYHISFAAAHRWVHHPEVEKNIGKVNIKSRSLNNMNKGFSAPIETKIMISNDVKNGLSLPKASKKHGVPQSCIFKWIKEKEVVASLGIIDISHRQKDSLKSYYALRKYK